MGLGYRVFIVRGDEVVAPISQRAFNAFWHGREPGLRKYARQTVSFAMAFYETRNRRPSRCFRIDGLNARVMSSGRMDQQFYNEGLVLAVNMVQPISASGKVARSKAGSVIDARHDFTRRQHEARHHRISHKLQHLILKELGLA
ncbi:hypothetical protein AYO46_07485 [Betaproteobacteria bacterium SCGC AG-212-J23]|nr:hypothetical protein AYO46_07485 [Betaproteobacteria bacterium SCGC AG-212-J23]